MLSKIIRKIEERITRELLLTANDYGWPCIGYDYGDGFKKETDYEKIVSECMSVEDVLLIFSQGEGQVRAWVRLIYGNEGWDLINDYSLTKGFEELVMQKMDSYTSKIEEKLFS